MSMRTKIQQRLAFSRRVSSGRLFLAAVFAFAATLAEARPVQVRIGTIALRGTTPYLILQEMGVKWKAAPDGGLTGPAPFGAFQGGEDGIISAMRQGQLHAALLTVNGLSDIEPNVAGLQNIPMAYRTLDEAAYVREKLAPKYEQQIDEKGFIVLGWCDYGWWQIFSTRPIRTPDDLRGHKLVVGEAGDAISRIANSLGMQPVPLEPNDIYTSLETGLASAVPAPPFFALGGQMFRPAKFMLELNWAPLVGGIVMSKRVWNQLTPAQQEAARAAAVEACEKVTRQGREEMQTSIHAMVEQGLTVQELEGDLAQTWRTYFESIHPSIRGAVVPEAEFDEIMRLLREYRAQPAGAAR